MKTRSMVLAALAPLVAISGANAAMDEMEAPEMRVWSAVLSEPSEESPGAALQITASKSASGSNGMVIESVALISTEVSKDDEGNMTETMSSVVCAGPVMVEGGSFMIEAAAMEEEGEMKEGEAEMAEAEGCAFAVSGKASNRYRKWYSWDLAGSVTMGETSSGFDISGSAPAMILEPEPEEEMSEEAKESS
jgi:hypothetical protein